MPRSIRDFTTLTLLSICFFATDSYGYIDPGSGHLILQALGVIFFGALFYVKQIMNFFRNIFSRK